MIGVIGGIGPEASANLYLKMIHYMQDQYAAVLDSDYPPMLIYSVSMEGFDEMGIRDFDRVRDQLVEACQKLEAAGAELIVIACNTVYHYYDELARAVSVEVVNIVNETADAVRADGLSKVGLLCSQSTSDLNVYDKGFSSAGIDIVRLSEQQQQVANKVIEAVMAGRQGVKETIKLKDIIRDMEKLGAQGVVLGCTELPLAINQLHTDVKLFDTIEIIIQRAVDKALGREPQVETSRALSA